MNQYKVDFTSIPWESPSKGMRQKIRKFDKQQLRLVEYSKELAPHWCEKGHIGYVVAGQLEIQFEHEIQQYAPGDGMYLPSGAAHKHKGKSLTETVTIIFVEEV